MPFNAATVLALMPAMGLALSVTPRNAGNAQGSNMCDISTFNDGAIYHITPAPVADCNTLVANLDTSNTFTVGHSWSRAWTYKDCAFSVRVISGQVSGKVGGADAVDLLNDSRNKFAKDGTYSSRGIYEQTVSAEGEVDCNSVKGGKVRVEWIVANSSYNPPN